MKIRLPWNPLVLIAATLAAANAPLAAAPQDAAVPKLVSVVRVNATDQAWDFFHPWT
jgi:hypothetical protein